jgi:hypothetical protein
LTFHTGSSQWWTFKVICIIRALTKGLEAPAVPENVSIAAKNKAAAYFNDPISSARLATGKRYVPRPSMQFHEIQ